MGGSVNNPKELLVEADMLLRRIKVFDEDVFRMADARRLIAAYAQENSIQQNGKNEVNANG